MSIKRCEIECIRSVIPSVIRGLENPEKKTRSLLIEKWPAIAGGKLTPHTRPQLTQKGILYVYVSEATIAYEISQKYRHSLLKRTQVVLGEDAVKELKVLVGK
ncbi:MAG TPA: DciA family protein [Candidatus Omnitrophota bacterium]|nr:DciA family protein [Candidatus Omnitrophota bacterium]